MSLVELVSILFFIQYVCLSVWEYSSTEFACACVSTDLRVRKWFLCVRLVAHAGLVRDGERLRYHLILQSKSYERDRERADQR